MTGWLYELLAGWNVSGFKADLAVGMVLSAFLMVSVVLVGMAIERFDLFLMGLTSKATGKKVASFILNRVMFIGTVFHELSHALFAVLTGAKVKKIRCFTLFSKELLGYVEFIPTGGDVKKAIQLSMVSCAPVMTGFVTVPLFCMLAFREGQSPLGAVLCAYCALSILCHMSMSKWDLQLYGKGAIFTYPILTILIVAGRYLLAPS